MYVRKFEADSLEEALTTIKKELGPDAIILKTQTNKGLKGAFKKNRVEITAAISEKNYTKKARVDATLEEKQKDKFYNNNSQYISKMIDGYSNNKADGSGQYNQLGLNKSVQSLKNVGARMKNSLDDFLSGDEEREGDIVLNQAPQQIELPEKISNSNVSNHYENSNNKVSDSYIQKPTLESDDRVNKQREKIDLLERKIFELSKIVEKIQNKDPEGIYQMRVTLRSLSISEQTINDILKKAMFELSEDEIQDSDTVFEFSLREMLSRIATSLPRFTELKESETSCITVLVSDNSCGQSSMMYKLGILNTGSKLIQYQSGGEKSFVESLFGLEVTKVNSLPDVISAVRNASVNGNNIFIDYRNKNTELNDTKKFIDGLKRSFGNVEVLICLSAIHSEVYNRKVLTTYSGLGDGVIISNLDLCLDYGALFNICEEFPGLPLKFFGTGEAIPDDIESATGERILAGMFKLN